MVQTLFDRLLPQAGARGGRARRRACRRCSREHGFDRVQHEQIRADLRSGRIGLAQNRLPANSDIEDVRPDDVLDATRPAARPALRKLGLDALADRRGGGGHAGRRRRQPLDARAPAW